MSAQEAWREVCMTEYRITGDMQKATTFADSVETRLTDAALSRALVAIDAERLHDDIGTPEDHAYSQAISDAYNAVQALMGEEER
ncbi:hypothetical protein OG436_29475 [Streptomyces caniferus]|uniref:hypothetical protein n=1 Tax=Streptomyces caniferus TaxID=285557 RepID=UPI002E2DDEA2|nr:hypothetical protein [Streptomyces caniferus]